MHGKILAVGFAAAILGLAAGLLLKKNNALREIPRGASDPVTSVLTETDWNDYIWPTDASRWMTSNFAEFRANHFHAGIDISTNMKEGYKVFAVRDGWLSRITFEQGGYGWYLVLRHPDGYYSTYGHLRGFPPNILAAYRRKQLALGRSFGTVQFDDREVPVKKGETVAFTGSTGAGPPHLHFEIRDARFNPVNPLLAKQIRIRDTIPPVIHSVILQPLDALSSVDGKNERLFLTPKQSRLPGNPVVAGCVGILVRASDLANEAKSGFTPYKLELFVDGKKHFDVTFNRIQDSLSWHIRIDRDHELMRAMKGEYRKLYREEGNLLSVYTPDIPGAGELIADSLGAGRKEIAIVATDVSGNSTRVAGTITVARPPAFTASIGDSSDLHVHLDDPAACSAVQIDARTPSGNWETLHRLAGSSLLADNRIPLGRAAVRLLRIEAFDKAGSASPPHFLAPSSLSAQSGIRLQRSIRYDEIVYRITSASVFAGAPVVTVEQNGREGKGIVEALSPSEYKAVVKGWPGFSGRAKVTVTARIGGKDTLASDELTLFDITAREGGEIHSGDGKFSARFRPGDVVRSMFCWVEKTASDSGAGYSLFPEETPLAGAPTVQFALPPGGAGAHSYIKAVHPGISMRHSIAQVNGNGAATVSARFGYFLAQYILKNDQTPPVIQIGFSGRKSAVCAILPTDTGSGIDAGTLKAYVDGKLANVEYSERRSCFVIPPDVCPKGAKSVTVTVADRAGNVSTVTKSFR